MTATCDTRAKREPCWPCSGVPDAARERILADEDSARLERWLEKAGTSATVAELFDEPS